MRFLPGNAQHIGARHSQQDSFGFGDPEDQAFIAHGGFLAIVCDGMGGMEHGDAASRTAVRAFLDAYHIKTPEESIPAALERSVREANAQVVALAHSLGMSEGIGTTLIAAALVGTPQDSAMYFISVGDSGLFHVSGGQVQTVNRPHVFANMLDAAVARGTMSKEDAENHPERESLTSYIGAEPLDEIDRNLEPWPVRDGDTILLASDGLFKTLDPQEIRGCLQGHSQSWPDTLVTQTLAKKREYQDNVTVLSVTVESQTRAAIPRTVLMAPPPPAVAGVPAASPPQFHKASPQVRELPRTVKLDPPPAPASTAQTPPPPAPPGWTPPVQSEPVARSQPTPGGKHGLWVLLVVLMLAAAGVGGWWFIKHRSAGQNVSHPQDPKREVPVPPRDHPPDLTPDPKAPSLHPPSTPEKTSEKTVEKKGSQ